MKCASISIHIKVGHIATLEVKTGGVSSFQSVVGALASLARWWRRLLQACAQVQVCLTASVQKHMTYMS